MNSEMRAKRNGDVRQVLDVGKQRAEADLNRKTRQRDWKVIGIVEIPTIFEDEVNPFKRSIDIDCRGLDSVSYGRV